MDDNPYRSPQEQGERIAEERDDKVRIPLPLPLRHLLLFFLGGWLSVIAGMVATPAAIACVYMLIQATPLGGVVFNQTADAILAGLILIPASLFGGWGFGKLYRYIFSEFYANLFGDFTHGRKVEKS